MWGVRKQASKHSASEWHWAMTNVCSDALFTPQRAERPAHEDHRHADDRLRAWSMW